MAASRREGAWWRFVRFGFRLLYNEFAFTYDAVSWVVSLGAWGCWQRSALRHLRAEKGARILEIAHGTGNLQIDLRAAGYRVVGHDLSRAMGRITQRKLARQGEQAALTRGFAQALPYPDATFAAVISTFPAEFIFAAETLHEVARVLQPSGQFIIVPNGVLTAGGAVAEGIEWLYRATGQRGTATPEDALAAFFALYGLRTAVFQEPCPRSVATVIVAKKSPSAST